MVSESRKIAATASGESVSGRLTVAAQRLLDEQARLEIGLGAAKELVAEDVTADVRAFLAGSGPVPDRTLRDTGRSLRRG